MLCHMLLAHRRGRVEIFTLKKKVLQCVAVRGARKDKLHVSSARPAYPAWADGDQRINSPRLSEQLVRDACIPSGINLYSPLMRPQRVDGRPNRVLLIFH